MSKQHKFLYPLEPLFGQVLSPFERFLRRTTAGGIVLVGTTLLTLLLANSQWGEGSIISGNKPWRCPLAHGNSGKACITGLTMG